MAGELDPLEAVRRGAQLLHGRPGDYDALLELIGDASYVLLGAASHGTQQFCTERARITRRLIEQKGFTALAVEADWPDAWRVNRYVRGRGDDRSAAEALEAFARFPRWTWRNTAVAEFLHWLHEHNAGRAESSRVGFYGLDLYGLQASRAVVLRHLERIDPEGAMRARERYARFGHRGEDPQACSRAPSWALEPPHEREILSRLCELLHAAGDQLRTESAPDAQFFAGQHVRCLRSAEHYYRTMLPGSAASWNLRERHMAGTLEALVAQLSRRAPRPKLIVWAHNSHLGDARATQMGRRGELNLGQLVRERHGHSVVSVGFTSYAGWVTAAGQWDGPPERMRLRAALEESYEALLHGTGLGEFLLTLRRGTAVGALHEPRLERSIGAVYRPCAERLSHYFAARLPAQFDALIHLDETSAVVPLGDATAWHGAVWRAGGEPPERDTHTSAS